MSLDMVIAVSFDEDRSAYEAFTNLKELDEQRQVSVRSAAIVERDEQGRVTTKDEVEDSQLTGAATGGLIGLVVGILGGPFGVPIAAADEAQRAPKHEARKKLHAERRSQLKEEIHERVEALKAKQRELRAKLAR